MCLRFVEAGDKDDAGTNWGSVLVFRAGMVVLLPDVKAWVSLR